MIEVCPRCDLTLDAAGACPKQGCDFTRPRLSEGTRTTGRQAIDDMRAMLAKQQNPTARMAPTREKP